MKKKKKSNLLKVVGGGGKGESKEQCLVEIIKSLLRKMHIYLFVTYYFK